MTTDGVFEIVREVREKSSDSAGFHDLSKPRVSLWIRSVLYEM